MDPRVRESLVSPQTTIRDTIHAINSGFIGIALVVNEENVLLGTVTDGDVRRAIVRDVELEEPVSKIMCSNHVAFKRNVPRQDMIEIMRKKHLRHIPILDEKDRVVDIVALWEIIPVSEPVMGERELEYVTECIKTNWVSSSGKFIDQFAVEFAQFCGADYAVPVVSGTAALHLALVILGIGQGDEVIVPTLTFIATANAVAYTGATPVFVDSEPHTWNIDPTKIEEKITANTKAIIPVHLYGHPADMDAINAIAKARNLFIIEDATEGLGALYKGQKVGTLSDIGCFSFNGNKLITTGGGGMVVTNNKEWAEEAKVLSTQAKAPGGEYFHPKIGYNYRLTNIQAALGLAQLEKIDEYISIKRRNAAIYKELLQDVEGISLTPEADWAVNVFWMYSLLIEKDYPLTKREFMDKLMQRGIDSRPFFYPLHIQPPYATGNKTKYPVAEELYNKGVNLPSSVSLTQDDIRSIVDTIKRLRG